MDKDPKAPARPTREAKLAEALRANLRRRKAAAPPAQKLQRPNGQAPRSQESD